MIRHDDDGDKERKEYEDRKKGMKQCWTHEYVPDVAAGDEVGCDDSYAVVVFPAVTSEGVDDEGDEKSDGEEEMEQN